MILKKKKKKKKKKKVTQYNIKNNCIHIFNFIYIILNNYK